MNNPMQAAQAQALLRSLIRRAYQHHASNGRIPGAITHQAKQAFQTLQSIRNQSKG